ncbi:MAG: hypothetical protein R3C46_16890 [Hyphomonadaceae bacterium]
MLADEQARGLRMRAWIVAVAAVVAAPVALAQPKVTAEIGAPYIPDGLQLRLTEECRIESSGSAPDAHLRCTPGLGWRLHDAATGEVVYPVQGYLPRDLEWAFAGPGAVTFLAQRQVSIVRLPSGETTELGPGDIEQYRDAEGLPFKAVVWTLPRNAGQPTTVFLLRPDGTLSDSIDADMRRVDYTRGLGCREAAVLAAIGAENLPNSTWSKIVRLSAAEEGRNLCDTVGHDRLAGLGSDGSWRRLDPKSFKAIGSGSFATADDALKAQ